jgi:hypothetical protein
MKNQEKQKIIKSFVEKAALPEGGQKLYWDDELKGFGFRLTSGGIIKLDLTTPVCVVCDRK